MYSLRDDRSLNDLLKLQQTLLPLKLHTILFQSYKQLQHSCGHSLLGLTMGMLQGPLCLFPHPTLTGLLPCLLEGANVFSTLRQYESEMAAAVRVFCPN